jgi:hypothetical protein
MNVCGSDSRWWCPTGWVAERKLRSVASLAAGSRNAIESCSSVVAWVGGGRQALYRSKGVRSGVPRKLEGSKAIPIDIPVSEEPRCVSPAQGESTMDHLGASEAQVQIAVGAEPVKAVPAGPPAAGPDGPALTEPAPAAGRALRSAGTALPTFGGPGPTIGSLKHTTGLGEKIMPGDARSAPHESAPRRYDR